MQEAGDVWDFVNGRCGFSTGLYVAYVVKMTMNVTCHNGLLYDVNNLSLYPYCLTCCVIHVYI